MTDAELQVRILKALGKGPLYLGVLPLIVDAHEIPVRKAVRELAKRGAVTVNAEATVRLA